MNAVFANISKTISATSDSCHICLHFDTWIFFMANYICSLQTEEEEPRDNQPPFILWNTEWQIFYYPCQLWRIKIQWCRFLDDICDIFPLLYWLWHVSRQTCKRPFFKYQRGTTVHLSYSEIQNDRFSIILVGYGRIKSQCWFLDDISDIVGGEYVQSPPPPKLGNLIFTENKFLCK